MYEILQAIKAKDLTPAIEYPSPTRALLFPSFGVSFFGFCSGDNGRWADKKRAQLEQRSSDLSFDLHRLQFIKLFTARDEHPAPQALAYAQANFPSFQQRHLSGTSQEPSFTFSPPSFPPSPFVIVS
jgi:CTLH/CRA C-terminal to LisH motif domain